MKLGYDMYNDCNANVPDEMRIGQWHVSLQNGGQWGLKVSSFVKIKLLLTHKVIKFREKKLKKWFDLLNGDWARMVVCDMINCDFGIILFPMCFSSFKTISSQFI